MKKKVIYSLVFDEAAVVMVVVPVPVPWLDDVEFTAT
jgi:hypothetical protein